MSGKKRLRKNRYKKTYDTKEAVFKNRFVTGLKLFGVLLCVSLMSASFIFCYDLMTQCEYFNAEHINIEGSSRLSQAEIIKQAQVEMDGNVLAANLSLIRKRLISHPWIRDAEVRRELPSVLGIKIEEHIPLAVVDLREHYLLNTNGEIFKLYEKSDTHLIPANITKINGLDYSDLNSEGIPQSIAFSSVMEALLLGKHHGINDIAVKRIDVDREIGLTIHLFSRVKQVKLGFDNYPDKYSKLKNILFHLSQQGNAMEIETIDLNSPNRIVVKPNQQQPHATQKEV